MSVIIASNGDPIIMLLLSGCSSLGLGLGLSLGLHMLMIRLVRMLLLMMSLLVMSPGGLGLRILMLVGENMI